MKLFRNFVPSKTLTMSRIEDSQSQNQQYEDALRKNVASGIICWYCEHSEHNLADKSCEYHLHLYKTIARDYFHGRKVGYKEITIPISRCQNCKKTHQKRNRLRSKLIFFSSIIAVAIFSLLVYLYAKEDPLMGYFWAIGGGIFLGYIIGLILYYTAFSKRFDKSSVKIKDETEVWDHPMVSELKKEGWSTTQPSP